MKKMYLIHKLLSQVSLIYLTIISFINIYSLYLISQRITKGTQLLNTCVILFMIYIGIKATKDFLEYLILKSATKQYIKSNNILDINILSNTMNHLEYKTNIKKVYIEKKMLKDGVYFVEIPKKIKFNSELIKWDKKYQKLIGVLDMKNSKYHWRDSENNEENPKL